MKIKVTPTPLKAIIALLILVAQSFIQKLAISESISFLKIIDELVVLYCIPFAIRVGFRLFHQSKVFKGFFFLISIYWLFAITSSLFGIGSIAQALYQFVLDSKYIIVFLYCYGAYREGISELYLSRFFKIMVLVNVPFVLLQLLAPSAYDAIFPTGAHHGSFFTTSGDALTRTAGIFWFTGTLAFFSSLASGFFLINIWKGNAKKSNYLYLALSLLLLISTLSRGEIGAFILAIAATYIFFISSQKIRHINLIFIIAILTSLILNNMDMIRISLEEIGFSQTGAGLTPSPRAQMMSSAISEANENFPLGAGLGTLGGQAAVVYDSDLFYKHGFQYLWYFHQGLFLTDTYWPKVFAESGWLGMLFLLLSYLYYPLKCLRSSIHLNFAGIFSFFTMTVMLINSFSAPVYNSPLLIFMVIFIVRFESKSKKQNKLL
ncbi:hypothetical protein KO495_02760 [Colwellia sp. D2M02]|uniref:hypothetical protein n=1 Tax=Colwellia sp. D2M02 TaxID=2841562 RepID=UPI001C09696A|nr:hypothetical protein [Colwellia sp. D2M02]MBU2892241.1 hypothetical protein [Colwellia sp. D2M02]